MKRFLSILIILSSFLFYADEVLAQEYSTIDISPISNLSLRDDYRDFPLGNVLFDDIPFQIAENSNNFLASNNLACPSCPASASLVDINTQNVKSLYLLVNSSDTFLPRFSNVNFASINLNFSNNKTFKYEFITGQNIREWLQSGNYGPTVNTVTSIFSKEVWKGFRPNPNYPPYGEYPAVADLLKIQIPSNFHFETLRSISINDESWTKVGSLDPGIIIKGITLETHASDLNLSLSVSTDWDEANKQLPIDRSAKVTVKVLGGDGKPAKDIDVTGEVLPNAVGVLNNTTVTTIENGEAHFVFTPSAENQVTLRFTAHGKSQYTTLNIYRPPVVIMPAMGASINIPRFIHKLPVNDPFWMWSPTARDSWDEMITLLESNNYQINPGYTIAFYDWRKSLDPNRYSDGKNSALKDSLEPAIDRLLQNKTAGQRVNVLAHSYGGIVTRSLIQNSNTPRINRFVTFGTPHRGSSNIYYIWEGGVMPPAGDPMFRIVTDSILKVYKHKNIITGLGTVHNEFPGFLNILPIYDNYIKSGGIFKSTNSLYYSNDVLNSSINTDYLGDHLQAKNIAFTQFYSKSVPTLRTLEVSNHTGGADWKDGKPVSPPVYDVGDNSVPVESSKLSGFESIEVEGEHEDIPDLSKGYIEQILRMNSSSHNGKKAPKNMLAALMLSPATVQITDASGTTLGNLDVWGDSSDDPKFAYAQDLPTGIYNFKVTGTGTGPYTLYVPYAGSESYWSTEFIGQTFPGKEEIYSVYLNTNPGGEGMQTALSDVRLRLGGYNAPRRILPVSFVFNLPDGFNTNQLEFNTIQVNGSIIPVSSYDISRNNRTVTVDVNGLEVGNAINWTDSEISLTVVIPGEEKALSGVLKYRHNWSGYKKFF